tara:strand:+ start:582 stop:800 length:219 start_codon:yes stop_codon:yes gene_type:complete
MEQYLYQKYQQRIYQILDNDNIDLYLREHYSESPNWYTNDNIKDIIESILWMTYTDEEKTEILNNELNDYFT